MNTVTFGPWEPDKAILNGQHAPEALGVVPSASGYAPLPSLFPDPVLSGLPGEFKGGISLYDTNNNPITVAGTPDALYFHYGGQWQEAGTGYAVAPGGRWNFARYGNTMIAVNGADIPQYATIQVGGLGDFADIEGAPVGSSVEIVKEFVVIGGVNKTKVRWSAIGNPLDWPVPGSNDAQYKQSDEQDFPDTGSAVAVAGGLSGVDMLIFTERAIYRGRYVGSPYFFQFDVVDKGRGAIAPRSVATGSNAVYFLSEEGFFASNGQGVVNIGFERVNMWFRNQSSDTRRNEVRSAVDPLTGIIFWTFPSDGAPEGIHDHLLIYHPQLDRWSHAKARTRGIFSCLSHGVTLEQLDAIGPLDSLPLSLDARVWKGGVPGMAVFDENSDQAWFAGPSMRAVLETGEAGGERFMLHGVRPLVDGAKADVTVLKRDFLHETPEPVPCAPVSSLNGVAYTHVSTRYARARVIIEEGEAWAFAIGCDLLAEKEGPV